MCFTLEVNLLGDVEGNFRLKTGDYYILRLLLAPVCVTNLNFSEFHFLVKICLQTHTITKTCPTLLRHFFLFKYTNSSSFLNYKFFFVDKNIHFNLKCNSFTNVIYFLKANIILNCGITNV